MPGGEYAPIAVFAFNRPDHLRQTLQALSQNDLAELSHVTVFCDGPRHEGERDATESVRQVARTARGFASLRVVERKENMGCGPSIIAGLQEMFVEHESLIIIEDDIVLAKNGLKWFNVCLEKYKNTPEVLAIAAWSYPERFMSFPTDYAYDAYFLPRFQCWGWAAWRDRIQGIDWMVSDSDSFFASPEQMARFAQGGEDLVPTLKAQVAKQINTWDIQVAYSAFKRGLYTLAPRYPYSTNIGTQGEGTHVGNSKDRHPSLYIDLSQALDMPHLPDQCIIDERILANFRESLHKYTPRAPLWQRVRERIKKIGRKYGKKNF
ncbi:MAG: hypothetical protein BCS36_00225 [Desulfovibrio sp. MES5]|uniref:hypothetical protein n=1 Tax=Desulfovibrio sp. MES5 TaxID=1899016 RepID=UPI000B9CC480|nr:hypothetical protein [Desulfovibrio sp. MES5]OXS29342.1 MAG: hypothetical protein BCS36_00225 [Desulfovibrio sp. MES5]